MTADSNLSGQVLGSEIATTPRGKAIWPPALAYVEIAVGTPAPPRPETANDGVFPILKRGFWNTPSRAFSIWCVRPSLLAANYSQRVTHVRM